jgi:hypothetical protein
MNQYQLMVSTQARAFSDWVHLFCCFRCRQNRNNKYRCFLTSYQWNLWHDWRNKFHRVNLRVLIWGMFVTPAPFDPLFFKKKDKPIYSRSIKKLNCYKEVEFFAMWINEKTTMLYINTVFKSSLKVYWI